MNSKNHNQITLAKKEKSIVPFFIKTPKSKPSHPNSKNLSKYPSI